MKIKLLNWGRISLTLVMVALASALGWHMWDYYMNAPWTRDGKIRVDVVAIAPDVAGFVDEVFVHDNQDVRKGDPLFRLDQVRFRLALEQAEANVQSAQASLEMANLDLKRYSQLDDSTVTRQKREQVVATQLESAAALHNAIANRDLAKVNLERTTVYASVNGNISNFSLQRGNYVSAGVAVGALVDTDSYYVSGYFEENKLDRISIDDWAEVRLMGSKDILYGRVQGIASGIQDRERADETGTLANVSPTFNWVRLAQRVPVRIHLENVPDQVRLVAGRTATVTILKEAPQPGKPLEEKGE